MKLLFLNDAIEKMYCIFTMEKLTDMRYRNDINYLKTFHRERKK